MFNPTTPPKGGQAIRDALTKTVAMKTPIVDELLYRRKVTLMAASPSTGKSTLATQIAMSVSGGHSVFGVLDVPAPCSVYYVPFETDWDEFVLCLQKAKGILPYDADKLVFDDGLLGIDVNALTGAEHIIKRIEAFKPGLIIIDPLYLLISGDLADGSVASKAMKWLQRLAVLCNAAVLVIHHTHRDRYNARGKKIDEADASYGSRWIQANVVVQFNVKSEGGGTKWTLIKDRYKLSRSELVLHYDPETGLSSALKSKTLIKDELLGFIKWHKPGSEFTYPGLAEQLECAEGYLSHLLTMPIFRKLIRKDAPPGKPVTLIRIYDEATDGPKTPPAPAATVSTPTPEPVAA